jgi:predicted deacylase
MTGTAPAPASAPSLHHLRVHRFAALERGPRLIVTGAVHGNETAGTRAIERILGDIERGKLDIRRGVVSFVPVCNPLAYANARRFGDRNLNRRLLPSEALGVAPGVRPSDYEDRIANVLCPLLAEHEVLLDLHSFRSAGEPFALRGPPDNQGTLEPFAHEAAEAALASHLGVRRIVDGWLDAYAEGVAARRQRALTPGAVNEDAAYGIGTTEYMRRCGGYAVTLECGQHEDPNAPGVGYHAIRQTLALLGLVDEKPEPPKGPFECLTLERVIDRHAEGDRFARGWVSFDAVAEGDLIAERADGSALRAPAAGYVVFPDHGALPGHEWFYFARPSRRAL